jgi:hypothetical protein
VADQPDWLVALEALADALENGDELPGDEDRSSSGADPLWQIVRESEPNNG